MFNTSSYYNSDSRLRDTHQWCRFKPKHWHLLRHCLIILTNSSQVPGLFRDLIVINKYIYVSVAIFYLQQYQCPAQSDTRNSNIKKWRKKNVCMYRSLQVLSFIHNRFMNLIGRFCKINIQNKSVQPCNLYIVHCSGNVGVYC